ncbi:MAG: methylated-DNA--[protein]-cysteine S-methyltransferase [Candidatus Binatia bacterium]
MTTHGFTIFDTPIGRCGIAWGGRGIVGLQLPEARERETRARMLRRLPAARETAPPPDVRRALDRVTALLRGEASDLSGIALDMDRVPPFHRRVYEVARGIPPGTTLSYGEVATRLGAPGSARAVGQALGRNPFAIVVPCHRVLAAGGKVGGFSADGGITTKLRLLAIEGAQTKGTLPLFKPSVRSAAVHAETARSSKTGSPHSS